MEEEGSRGWGRRGGRNCLFSELHWEDPDPGTGGGWERPRQTEGHGVGGYSRGEEDRGEEDREGKAGRGGFNTCCLDGGRGGVWQEWPQGVASVGVRGHMCG